MTEPAHDPDAFTPTTGMGLGLALLWFGEEMTPDRGPVDIDELEAYAAFVAGKLATHPSAVIEARTHLHQLVREAPTSGRCLAILTLDRIEAILEEDGRFGDLMRAELDRHLAAWLA